MMKEIYRSKDPIFANMSQTFNPNDPGTADSNIFGLPYLPEAADVVILPLTWEATVSYGAGTANGPKAVLEASKQIDLFHPEIKEVWKHTIAMDTLDDAMHLMSTNTRIHVDTIIAQLTNGEAADHEKLAQVNQACQWMVDQVKQKAQQWMAKGKIVVGLGGDHSTPLGLMQALAEQTTFGILQIDAHCDLRNAYEGFKYSHASVMYNALKEKNIIALTQVGIRDYCQEEVAFANNDKRVRLFTDREMRFHQMEGRTWAQQCDIIINTLPQDVFISFDIDGLSPDHCPNTGTPVPGGLSFQEVNYLFTKLAKSGKKIIGFDLNEVSPGDNHDWDANVGARVLFLLYTTLLLNKQK